MDFHKTLCFFDPNEVFQYSNFLRRDLQTHLKNIQKSTKNQAKIDLKSTENRSKIKQTRPNAFKIALRELLGAQGALLEAPLGPKKRGDRI